MEQWERNREKSRKYGADSSIDIMRRDSNDDLMYGDTERPPNPMNYPGVGKNDRSPAQRDDKE